MSLLAVAMAASRCALACARVRDGGRGRRLVECSVRGRACGTGAPFIAKAGQREIREMEPLVKQLTVLLKPTSLRFVLWSKPFGLAHLTMIARILKPS